MSKKCSTRTSSAFLICLLTTEEAAESKVMDGKCSVQKAVAATSGALSPKLALSLRCDFVQYLGNLLLMIGADTVLKLPCSNGLGDAVTSAEGPQDDLD